MKVLQIARNGASDSNKINDKLDTNNNIYLFLLNKYKAKIEALAPKDFYARVRIINELKRERDYNELLTTEKQEKLYYELMGGN